MPPTSAERRSITGYDSAHPNIASERSRQKLEWRMAAGRKINDADSMAFRIPTRQRSGPSEHSCLTRIILPNDSSRLSEARLGCVIGRQKVGPAQESGKLHMQPRRRKQPEQAWSSHSVAQLR